MWLETGCWINGKIGEMIHVISSSVLNQGLKSLWERIKPMHYSCIVKLKMKKRIYIYV